MQNFELENVLNNKLNIGAISDYAPNGLQVEGRTKVKKIITGVTASKALIEFAIANQADTILVHHGYFWKGENQCIKGMKGARIKLLCKHDINLLAYHLPLDIDPDLGNNVMLAKIFGLKNLRDMEGNKPSIPVIAEFDKALSGDEFRAIIEQKLGRKVLHEAVDRPIKTVGICSGGGQGYIDLAAAKGCDAYITGEVSEQTIHSAREQNIHFYAMGHHASERYGVKALGEWLQDYAKSQGDNLEVIFKDIDNPA